MSDVVEAVRTDSPVSLTGASGDTTPLLTDAKGRLWTARMGVLVTKDIATVAAGSIVTAWTPASGKKFRLMGMSISSSAAVNLLLEDNSAGAGNFIFRTPTLVVNTPYNFDLGDGFLSAAANNVLKMTSSGAANITGTVWGVEEA